MQSNENDDGWPAENTEEEYLEDIERQPNYEELYLSERDSSIKNIFHHFQDSATSIATLYRDRLGSHETGALWIPFQTAAGTVTTLYKESCDGIRRTSETAMHSGYQRRTREIADWARSKRRRYIRREDLLAYLAGKSPPPSKHVNKMPQHHYGTQQTKQSHSPNHLVQYHHQNQLTSHQTQPLNDHHLHGGGAFMSNNDSDMHTFKEALARRPRGPELYAFVAGEIARHCKRPASPLDVNMDVQSHKRQRFM